MPATLPVPEARESTEIEVLRNVFEKNEHAARENREAFDRLGVCCINLLGGAGCGKTSILEAVLPRLRPDLRAAVLEGDLKTTRDAERIARLGVPVIQLLTDGGCHLNATLVQRGLAKLPLGELDVVIIENVGNPICPANFDLGEHHRLAALSVTDGDDKPSKYPLLYRGADLVVLTKADLLEFVQFDLETAWTDLRRVNIDAPIIPASVRTGQGMDRIADWIRGSALVRRVAKRG